MVRIEFYNDSYYGEIKKILQEVKLYDDVWEARENLKRKIKRDSQSIIVAKEDSELIGCVFVVEDGWNGFIFRLAVKKEYQKKGIGSMLLQKAEEIIKSRNIKEASLLVDPKDESLKNWYKKRGYKQASDWTFMFKKL